MTKTTLRDFEEVLEELMELAKELGWKIAIPTNEEGTAIEAEPMGITMGTDEYIEWILQHDDDHAIVLKDDEDLN